MISFPVSKKQLSCDGACLLASVAVDMDITLLIDGNVGVYVICPKKVLTQ